MNEAETRAEHIDPINPAIWRCGMAWSECISSCAC